MITEEEKEKKLRERQESAAKKKMGKGITLLAKTTISTESEDFEVLKVIATENMGLRTIKDVKNYMEDNDIVGVVYPVRMGKAIERVVQQVARFINE